MPRTFLVCRSENRDKIDKDLVEGKPYRSIAGHYGASPSAVLRHKQNDIPVSLSLAKQASDIGHAQSILAQMLALNARTMEILGKAERRGELKIALTAIETLRRNQELIGKLSGELGMQKPQAHAHLHLHREVAKRDLSQATDEELDAILNGTAERVPDYEE